MLNREGIGYRWLENLGNPYLDDSDWQSKNEALLKSKGPQRTKAVCFALKNRCANARRCRRDGCVNDKNLARVLHASGKTGDRPEDLNRDGVVDDADLLEVLFNFGGGCEG